MSNASECGEQTRNFVDYVCIGCSTQYPRCACPCRLCSWCSLRDRRIAPRMLRPCSEWCVLLHVGTSLSKSTCLWCVCMRECFHVVLSHLSRAKRPPRRERQNVFNERCNKSCFGRLGEGGVVGEMWVVCSLQVPVSLGAIVYSRYRSVKWWV